MLTHEFEGVASWEDCIPSVYVDEESSYLGLSRWLGYYFT